ncbi:MAG TPA: exodeoxyribonuclease VII small subunit [Ornithinibacter sp.]|nr:exodeoxyribonuclease VII small subunit [Ornithinibacter sp.]
MATKVDATPGGAPDETPDETAVGTPEARSGEHADVAAMTYEQARDELVGLVTRLESGQVGLEESMSLWQRGEVLATHCSQWLDRAEARITAGD